MQCRFYGQQTNKIKKKNKGDQYNVQKGIIYDLSTYKHGSKIKEIHVLKILWQLSQLFDLQRILSTIIRTLSLT